MEAEQGRALRALLSSSPEATEALAQEIGAALPAGGLVALTGELGAGKTCFVRGLARGLGIFERVSSPTFTLMHTYEGRRTLYHYDAWMEGRERAYLADGGGEWLGEQGIAAVEWAERVAEWLPLPHLRIELVHVGPLQRLLRMAVAGTGPAALGLTELVRSLALPQGVQEVPAGSEGRT